MPSPYDFSENTAVPDESAYAGTETEVNESAGKAANVDMNAIFDAAFQEAVPPKKEKKKSPVGKILLAAIVIILAALFLFPSSRGWSEEDAKNATQAYLDYYFNKDDAGYAEYVEDMTEEELAERRQAWRDDLYENSFAGNVPVSDSLKAAYADFFMELRGKAEYEVGEAEKTETGFEVPVTVRPITSFAHGEYTLLDVQHDDWSKADLNERFYSEELRLLQELTQNPDYGSPEILYMYIAKGEDGYKFSEKDLREIEDSYYVMDRHWTSARAGEAVEAVLGGVYREDYAGMAEWTIATREEIEDTFGDVFSVERMRETINEMAAQIMKEAGIDDEYEASDELAEKLSKANKSLLKGTKYEIMAVEGDEEEYAAKVKVTPFAMDNLEEELHRRLEAEMFSLNDMDAFITRDFELISEIISEIIEGQKYADPITLYLHLRYDQNKAYSLDYDEIVALYRIYEEDGRSGLSEEGESEQHEQDPEAGAEEEETFRK